MRPSDLELSRLAVAWGWLDQADLERYITEADRCQAMGLEKGIDEVLLEERRLTSEQIRKLRRHLGWSLERVRIGGYEILRRIGVGGSGSVFEARHVRLNQKVALKVLYPRYARDSRMTGRFLREARALARLNHPHLVHAFDAGRDGRYYYLAMEYVDGENLLQYLTRRGPLAVSHTLDIVKAACGALGALEARRLVHRDVKPANILLTEDGGVKLTDLGLLKVERRSDAPAVDWVCGTPHYLSPEQARGGGEEDIRSDLYSLGATWYHALAGRPPFVGASSREIIIAHTSREPPPLRRIRDDVPPALERAVLRWLAKDPRLRPQTTGEALAEIERLERRARVRAAWKPVLRPWMAVALVLVVACALAIWLLRGESVFQPERASPLERGRAADPEADVGAARPESESATGTTAPTVERSTGGSGHVASTERAESRPEGGPQPDGTPSVVAETPDRSIPAPTPTPEKSRPGPGDISAARLLVAAGRELRQHVSSIESRWRQFFPEGGWRRWEAFSQVARARYADLRPLERDFHASSAALVAGRDSDVLLLLRYDFATRSELDDFRLPPGSVRVDRGDLVAGSDFPAATLTSVYWLAPPVRLRGEVAPGTRLTLGFGDLRVLPWGELGPEIWRDPGPRPSQAASPHLDSRPVFEFRLGDRLVLRTGETVHVHTIPIPIRGRISLRLEAGRLRWLHVESRLEVTWASERLRLLEEVR